MRLKQAPGETFKMVSVQATDPPDSAQGADWFRYVIGQGSNRIVGYRQGSSATVMLEVEQMVVQLNERRMGKYATPRGRPAGKQKAEEQGV